MPHFKHYSYDQTKLIPVDFRNQLQPGTFEFALNQLVDEMDLSIFTGRFCNDDTGAPAYDPAILLKIVLFAYSRGITSSREISRACRENVVFMALAADSHPHFTTIARFIASLEEEITPLFRNVILICSREGLIGGQMFAIDGCKISSNCSKEWSGTRADLKKKAEKLDRSIRQVLSRHRQADRQEEAREKKRGGGGPSGGMRAKEARAIGRLRAKKAAFEEWLAENEDKRGARGKIKQSNVIDNESAKMPSSHGVIQGYNGLAMVDEKHQVIVHSEAFGEGNENHLLGPMLEGTRENLAGLSRKRDPLRKAVLVGDSAYHSEENARMVLESGIDAYLPDARFRKRDPAFKTAKRHKRPVDRKGTVRTAKYFQVEDFTYDAEKGKLICPAGKELYVRNRNFWTKQGLRGVQYMAKKTDCRVCDLRKQCLRRATTVARQVVRFAGTDREGKQPFRSKMIERFESARGRFLYSRRMGIVEPVFGNICHALGLRYFSHRGKVKVDIQWKLFGMVHNLAKIARYGPRFALEAG